MGTREDVAEERASSRREVRRDERRRRVRSDGGGSAGSTPRGAADTRSDLLAAGARLYGTPALKTLRCFTAGAVADEAGYHRQTFYRYWDTQEQYVADLVRFTLDGDDVPLADGVVVVPERRHAADVGFEDMARDIARYDFERLTSDPAHRARVGFWSLRSAVPGIDGSLARSHDRAIECLAEGYGRLFDRWGREPRPPFDLVEIATVLRALLQGMVLVPGGSGGPDARCLYEKAVSALLPALTREAGAAPDGDRPPTGAA